MSVDNLFSRVKNAIRGQKSSFCSRSTKVTILGNPRARSNNSMGPQIQYTNCDGNITNVLYEDIVNNGGYIDDCVQGGCPISFVDITQSFNGISESNGPQPNLKLFVQYGTTDCNTPPPGSNLILFDCKNQTPYNVSRGSISTTLTKGDICYITFKDNVVTNGCYEIGEDTSDASVDTIEGEPQSFARNCLNCEQAINVTITDCDKGTTFVVDPNTIPLTNDGVYLLYFNDEQLPSGCYTIGNRTTSEFVATIKNDGSIVPFNDCPSCLNPPA